MKCINREDGTVLRAAAKVLFTYTQYQRLSNKMGSLGPQVSQRWANPTLPDSVFEMFSMKGKVTIITGGSGGIGYEVARGLAEAGSDIALWYYKATNADKLAASLEKDFGVKAKAYQCDVAKYEQVKSSVDAVVKDFGKLDVMIANAGIPSKAGGLDDKLEDWHRVVGVDFDGAYFCARAAGEIFRAQGSGNLIFTASMSGHAANVPQQQVRYAPFHETTLC